MAKCSIIARQRKRLRMVAKYAKRRAELQANKDYAALDRLPRDSSPVRLHNRCQITGRPRGYFRKFGLSRIACREMFSKGEVPGIKKASW